MATILTSDNTVQALKAGIKWAQQGNHQEALNDFKRAYEGINRESQASDTEVKFQALRLMGHAAFKGENFQGAYNYFLQALQMGERLFPKEKKEEKGIIYCRLSQCQKGFKDFEGAKKTADQGLQFLGNSYPQLRAILEKVKKV